MGSIHTVGSAGEETTDGEGTAETGGCLLTPQTIWPFGGTRPDFNGGGWASACIFKSFTEAGNAHALRQLSHF
jgi:hypothetical protein